MILAHYAGSFTNRTPKKRIITKKYKTPVHPPRKPSEIRSSPPPNPLPNRRRTPEPISTRWRPQRRTYFWANQPTLPPRHIGQFPYPLRILRFHRRQPEQSSDFHQRSSFSRLIGSTTSSLKKTTMRRPSTPGQVSPASPLTSE